MSIKELHRDHEFVLYEYTELSERPATPDALQYQEAYRNTKDGNLFYKLYEFIGDDRKVNILDFLNTKIKLANEVNDTREVDELIKYKEWVERQLLS